MKVTDKKNLVYSRLAWEQQTHMTIACPVEMTALGMMDDPDDENVVVDFHSLPQQCTGSSTEVDPIELSKLSMRLEKAGRDPSKLKCWWH